jgi:hypothetical protein
MVNFIKAAELRNICSTNFKNISKGAAHRNMFITVRCTFGNILKISATNIEVLCTKLTILSLLVTIQHFSNTSIQQ